MTLLDEERQRHLVDVRSAAHSVVLAWRGARSSGGDHAIDDQLERSLDSLLAVFERRAARHLGSLFAHQAMEWAEFPVGALPAIGSGPEHDDGVDDAGGDDEDDPDEYGVEDPPEGDADHA